MHSDSRTGGPPGVGALVVVIAVFAALGFPLVFEIWETVNAVLTGNLAAVQLQWFVPAVVALPLLLLAMGRVLRRWLDDK